MYRKKQKNNIPIMHWFTGNTIELQEALALGCMFSVNPKMCYSKSGRDIIMQIPLDRILPETDSPFTSQNDVLYMPWDTEVVEFLATQYGMPIDEINNQMENNFLEICNNIVKA